MGCVVVLMRGMEEALRSSVAVFACCRSNNMLCFDMQTSSLVLLNI
jgi:hypothetical protein